MTINCSVEGCSTQIEINEPVSGNARFICKNHPRAAQVRAAGRPYDERRDEYDKGVHFQDVQFDHDIARLTSYNGNRRPALHELDGDSGCRNYEDKNA